MAKEPVPQEVVEMLTFLTIHKATIASFFGIRLIPSSRERNINRILEFPGDHMIIHDTVLGVPSAFLAIYCSRPTFENVRAFLDYDAPARTFDFLHKRHGIWKTEVRLADDGAPIVSFIITNVTNVLPLEELASIPVSKVHDHNITLVEAAEVTLNRVKKRMPAVIALLQEFLPDEPIVTEEGTFSKSSFIHALKNDTFSLADKIEVGNLKVTTPVPEAYDGSGHSNIWVDELTNLPMPGISVDAARKKHTARREGDKIIFEGPIEMPKNAPDFFDQVYNNNNVQVPEEYNAENIPGTTAKIGLLIPRGKPSDGEPIPTEPYFPPTEDK